MTNFSGLPVQAGPVEVARAKRSAVVAGAAIAAVVAVFAAVASAVLLTLGVAAVLLGIVFCLTLVGVVIGIPLIVLGLLSIFGGAIGGIGGIFFALLLGAGSGFLYYRHRLRRLR